MKKIMISLTVLLMVCGCGQTSGYRPSEDNPVEISDPAGGRCYSACRLILVVNEDASDEGLEKLAGRYSMSVRWLMKGTIVLLESELPFSERDLSAIRGEIESADFVESVEYDYIIKLDDPIEPPLVDF